ncbi:FixH family protein [Gilvimarinus sp. F26214L]|uniref:FixH family protein n=1 Tax=Gilvimarinus sp. DZF01 TaxID=3461371 RepID=UPI004046105F
MHIVSDLRPIPINRMHHWTLELRDSQGEAITNASIIVSGGMPAHDHGLPTNPQVRPTGEAGVYRLEGLRFHMPGAWTLSFQIAAGERDDVLHIDLEL